MRKIHLRSVLFTSYTLILAILITAYMGDKIYLLNFYILPILFGAYYFSLFGGIILASICSLISIYYAHRGGFPVTDTSIIVHLVTFFIIGIIAGVFQRQNNYLKSFLLNASLTDELTGLYNYRHFSDRLKEEISRAERYKRTVGLIMIDIDKFKKYNDTYGHQKGNIVLQKIADLLKRGVRQSDIVFRYGGEEFCIILPETHSGVYETAERLRKKIENENFPSKTGTNVKITISAGVSYHPLNKKSEHTLFERTDKALYEAKKKGRNTVCIFH